MSASSIDQVLLKIETFEMNVLLPSWEELDGRLDDVHYATLLSRHDFGSNSLPSLHSSSTSSPSATPVPNREESNVSRQHGRVQMPQDPPQTPIERTASFSSTDLRVRQYQDVIVGISSAIEVIATHVERALAEDAARSSLEELKVSGVGSSWLFHQVAHFIGSKFFKGALTKSAIRPRFILRAYRQGLAASVM